MKKQLFAASCLAAVQAVNISYGDIGNQIALKKIGEFLADHTISFTGYEFRDKDDGVCRMEFLEAEEAFNHQKPAFESNT